MTVISYRPQNFGAATQAVIDQARLILEEYEAEGFSMTLRQLYYQFVSRDLIPNSLQSYKRLGDILNNARMAGEISWDLLEDRTRNVQDWAHQSSPAEALANLRKSYFVDRWDNQPTRVLVMVEKDALVGVIEPVCGELDISFIACRGYLSQSEAWRLGQRIKEWRENGQDAVILHLGDHDPSGIDMTRDNRERLTLFAMDHEEYPYSPTEAVEAGEVESVELRRLALNYDQVRRYNPPPNPAKMTDARAEGYVRAFGRSSWELDALNPRVIAALIRDEVQSIIDEDRWAESEAKQTAERATLDRFIASLEDE